MTRSESFVVNSSGGGILHTRGPVSTMLLVAGCAFAFIGFADMLLLWFPTDLGNVAWEFATVGRTLDSQPLSSLGLLLMGYGVLRAPRPTPTGVMLVSAIFALLALFTAFLGMLIFTSVPAVISQTPPEAAAAVQRAATRHGVQGVIYPIAWTIIAVVVWRARRNGEPS